MFYYTHIKGKIAGLIQDEMITVKEISNDQNGITHGFSNLSKGAQAGGYLLSSFLNTYLKSNHYKNTIQEKQLLIRSKACSGVFSV